MSLPACQQRALDALERTLEASETRLTAMFAMFTRLTRDELPADVECLSSPVPRGLGTYLLVPVLATVALIASETVGLGRVCVSAFRAAASRRGSAAGLPKPAGSGRRGALPPRAVSSAPRLMCGPSVRRPPSLLWCDDDAPA